jgi:hypothetical protein
MGLPELLQFTEVLFTTWSQFFSVAGLFQGRRERYLLEREPTNTSKTKCRLQQFLSGNHSLSARESHYSHRRNFCNYFLAAELVHR